jgi:hypothetical protein
MGGALEIVCIRIRWLDGEGEYLVITCGGEAYNWWGVGGGWSMRILFPVPYSSILLCNNLLQPTGWGGGGHQVNGR